MRYLRWWLSSDSWDVTRKPVTYVDYLLEDVEDFDYDTADMYCYALYQALHGEFDDIAICPFTGKPAVTCDAWTEQELFNLADPNDYYWFYCNYNNNWSLEDKQAFSASCYLQTVNNPNTSWLVDQHYIYQREYSAEYLTFVEDSNKETQNYYNWHPTGNCQEITQEFNFNLGQAVECIYKSGAPFINLSTKIEDLQKAISYLQFEIERVQQTVGSD